jgi:uncharacterized DUF497 family protein
VFEEAQTVFFDEHGLLLEDPDPDDPEERFVLIGLAPRYGCSWFAIAFARVAS